MCCDCYSIRLNCGKLSRDVQRVFHSDHEEERQHVEEIEKKLPEVPKTISTEALTVKVGDFISTNGGLLTGSFVCEIRANGEIDCGK